MLGDRGYLVGGFDRRMSKMDFIQKFGEFIMREDLTINKSKKNDPPDQLYVFFPSDEKVGEVFQEAELLVNIKKHVLVPEHQVLITEDKKTLLERYTLKETQPAIAGKGSATTSIYYVRAAIAVKEKCRHLPLYFLSRPPPTTAAQASHGGGYCYRDPRWKRISVRVATLGSVRVQLIHDYSSVNMRVKGNEVSTWAGEALILHVCMEALSTNGWGMGALRRVDVYVPAINCI
ncbi:hypothetical protein KSP39_PZI007844 [Platanthera zijinensis]|uniref:Uncharacterized protein n=1 Tax=Platanthera zijinensis TaxID=2320716 RepID=A0AAP0BQ25_9ASPA